MRPFLIFIFLSCVEICGISQSVLFEQNAIQHPIVAKNGMVASQHKIASEVGVEILKQGGNAVDAAVAVGFALAVVLPRAGNLGGGGFMLVHLADEDKTIAINYREKAPLKSTKDMYLTDDGEVDVDAFQFDYLSIGVPGTVAGLIYALENYGTMKLKEVIKPAIKLASKGFVVTNSLELGLNNYQKYLSRCEATKKVFYKGSECYKQGQILKQKDLAKSLKEISKKGKSAFYNGTITDKIVQSVQVNGGILTHEDFNAYHVEETPAVSGIFKDFQVLSMPPPSSGGIHIIQMLNIIEEKWHDSIAYGSADYYHLLAETMRLAYADRSKHLGDPNFWNVPVDGLTSKKYAQNLCNTIADTARNSSDVLPGNPTDFESEETTHFSVADKDGNVVSNTYTLNFSFGSGLMAEGTGILLNNEMGDFSAKPGSPNAFGLIGGEANSIVPGKRPLSSMTPTIVFHNGQVKLITGSPGGSRIITTVLQIILNTLANNMNIAEATHAPRIHHQWYPDILFYEEYISPDTKKLLKAKGHQIKQRPAMGSTQSIWIENGWLMGASDPRRPDAATVGF